MVQYPPPPPPPQAARYANLDTNRSLTKYILIGIVTFGLYSIWVTARAGEDLNLIAGRWDNKRSMNYWLVALLIGPLTLGIAYLVWWHKTSNRIGNELARRGMARDVTASDFWLWDVLGAFIIVGPFIFMFRWLRAMNHLCADYNVRG